MEVIQIMKARKAQKECWNCESNDFVEIFGKDIKTYNEDNKFVCAKYDNHYEIKIREFFLDE